MPAKLTRQKRRGTGESRQAKRSTAATIRDNFLKNKIWPVTTALHPELQNIKKVERAFFASLSYLSQLYRLTIRDIRNYPYPYNMSLAYGYAKAMMEEKGIGLIVVTSNDRICLSTYKSKENEKYLCYLPIKPVMQLMKVPGKRHSAELLLSVLSYLDTVVKVPIYGMGNTAVDKVYDYITEDLESQDWEEMDTAYCRGMQSHIETAYYYRRRLQGKWRHPIHLGQFYKRLKRLQPRDEEERTILAIAQQAYKLFRYKPTLSFEWNFPPDVIGPQDNYRLDSSHYFCFYWDSHPAIDEQLVDQMNCYYETGEYIADEPITFQVFDKPQQKERLDFKHINQLFELLFDLCDYLMRLHEKYNTPLSA